MKRRPTRKTAAPRLRPIPGTPSEQHNPTVTLAFKRKGFRLINTGGNVMAYAKSDSSIGEVLVSDEGYIPVKMSDPVEVLFFGTEHSEHLLALRFPSASAFLATIRR